MTVEEVMKTVCYNDFNVTFSGGDPMYSAQAIVPLAKKIKEACGEDFKVLCPGIRPAWSSKDDQKRILGMVDLPTEMLD